MLEEIESGDSFDVFHCPFSVAKAGIPRELVAPGANTVNTERGYNSIGYNQNMSVYLARGRGQALLVGAGCGGATSPPGR